jgi:hypothetical protein
LNSQKAGQQKTREKKEFTMKRFTKILFVVGSAALLFATQAQAQVTSTSNPLVAPPAAAVDITLTGVIQSSLVLTVSGTAGNALRGSVNRNMSVGRSLATFDFGTFNTQSAALTNGTISRAGAGAFAVASLSARVTISGSAANATIGLSTVADATGTSPIVDGNVRFSRVSPPWTAVTDGTNLAFGAAASAFCPVAVCVSGTDYAHQLAVYIPDNQGAGNFNQVVSYDASL